MRRADRLIELVGCLKAKPVVLAEELAAHLEVSVRTIYRDLAGLQAMGLPIEGQAGVGFMLRGDIHLPPIAFDHDELEALALGLAYVEQVGDPALAAAARAARGKVDLAWNARNSTLLSARPLRSSQRPERRSPAIGAALRGALRVRREIRFGYVDAEGRPTTRWVRPLALIAFSEGWLLGAWCLGREDFRTFRLDRMSELEVCEAFVDEAGRDLAAYLNQTQNRHRGTDGSAGKPG
jgi:predicted DNA-binding transcriptional regulator YafY